MSISYKDQKMIIKKDCKRWKESGNIIVFANGCFDLLHRGHVDLLTESKKLGDILIIGLNSDSSVKLLKGDSRPIQSEDERMNALLKTDLVSKVYIFSEETPIKLITLIKPDILVKGGDYLPDEVVGFRELKSWGGRIEIVPLTPNYSTTSKIEKMKRQGLV